MSQLYVCKEYETPNSEGYRVVRTIEEHNKTIYNQALEDFYNGLADELLWIRERFGDDAYMEARCSVGCLQNRLTK